MTMPIETEWLTKYRAFNDVLQRRLAMQQKENDDKALSDAQLAKLLRHRLERVATVMRNTPFQFESTRQDVVNELLDIADALEERLARPAR